MKASIKLYGSLTVVAQAIALLVDHGFDVDDEGVVSQHDAATPFPTPSPAAVAAPVSPAPSVAVASAELDSTGMPWDERIHASTKTKTAKDAWTKRKGVAADVYNAVEAELRARFPNVPTPTAAANVATASGAVAANPVAEIPLPVAPAVAAPVGTIPVPMASPIPAVAAPSPVPVAPAPVAPSPVPVAPAPVATPTNLHELLAAMVPYTENGTITPEYLTEAVVEINNAWAAHGVHINSIADLGAHPQVVSWVWQLFQNQGKVAA